MCRFSSPPLCHVRETSGSRYISSHTRRFSLVSVQSWRIEKRRLTLATPTFVSFQRFYPGRKTGGDISVTAFFLPFQVDYIHRSLCPCQLSLPLFVTSSLSCARDVRLAIFLFPHSAFFSCIRPILADRKTPPHPRDTHLRQFPEILSWTQNRRRHLCHRLLSSISGGLHPPLFIPLPAIPSSFVAT